MTGTRGWVEAQRLEATTRGGRPVPRIEPQWGTYRPGRDRWVREELAATAMDVRASPLAITPIAHTLTTTRLRKRIRAMLIAMDPAEAAAQRSHAARQESGVRRRRHRHGLATLEITGPAVEIEAAYTRIDHARTALDTFTDAQAQAQGGGVEPDPDTLPPWGSGAWRRSCTCSASPAP